MLRQVTARCRPVASAGSRLQRALHGMAPLHVAAEAPSAPTAKTPASPENVRAAISKHVATIKKQTGLTPAFWGNVSTTLAKCRTPEQLAATAPLRSLPMAWHSSTPAVQHEIVRILLATHDVETAMTLVASAPEYPLHNRNVARLLGACVRHRNLAHAGFALYERSLAQGTVPSIPVYHAVLLLALKANDPSRFHAVLTHMETVGVPLDAMCHGLAVRMACRQRHFEAALDRYRLMQRDKMHLNVIVLNELLDGLCEMGAYTDALEVFESAVEKVEKRPWNQKPDGKVVLSPEAKAKADDKAPVNEVTYNIMMKLCGRQQRLDEVFKWYEDMKAKGIAPSTTTINTLMHAVYHGKYRSVDSEKVYAALATVGAIGAGTLFVSDLSEATASVAITASVLASLGLGIYMNPFGVQKSIYPNETTAKEPIPAAMLRRLDEEEHIGRLVYLWHELLGYGLSPDDATYDIFVRTSVRKRHPDIAVAMLLESSNPNSFAARRAVEKDAFVLPLPLETTIRLLQSLVSQNLLPQVDDVVALAYKARGLESITSTSPSRLTRFRLVPFGAPKVTALVLSRLLRLWLDEHYPKDKLHARIHDTVAFDVIQCHTVLDYLDTIDPEIRASFAFEEVQVAGNGNGVLHFNRARLQKYIVNLA
ncbi:hypothetical protein SPRG_10933 [Saprolegnia parasitica CBS 223.65]|uniref:Pentacotripeptide-repeat region of PRORP domain-containing protein n=1 Tax=Saprolegnia parasitica (strain CBS 223.65) TaxID=695850 RepID=A0A067BUB2_SAPPC|nr:hypothetical protein SPRG_10933 [Saprolegnia parasitica CBS 223.65]KDO22114.1 hypothetical protein SPRG_10933 [Saprolegnia parasitica CBS 223.65]|eukprot:XP_012207153.1 hypothetical protein SPRG_10933 [Saprolegnia parasitica CBS 223.65]